MELYKIRISRDGPRLPFSLAYVFKGRHLHELRRHFELFLGFSASHFPHSFDKICRGDAMGEGQGLRDVIPDLLDPVADWHVMVPIMSANAWWKGAKGRRGRKGEARDLYRNLEGVDLVADALGVDVSEVLADSPPAKPHDAPAVAYLVEKDWRNWTVADPDKDPIGPTKTVVDDEGKERVAFLSRTPYPDTAYLSTLLGVLSPPCLACPRLLHHEDGQCEIGDAVCFKELNQFKSQAQMVRHLAKYEERMTMEAAPNVLNPNSD